MSTSKLVQAEDVTPIVIENGSSWTRVGYAGEGQPRHIIPTPYAKSKDGSLSFGWDAVNTPEDGKNIYNPCYDGYIQDWDAMGKQWKYIYSDLLHVDSSEQPLLITENAWNPLPSKQAACETAFEELNVPVFSIVKSALCATYQSTRPTALVIDIGSAVASVTPVIDGTVITKAAVHSKFAGDFMNLHILTHLRNQRHIDIVPPYLVKKKSVVEPGSTASPELYQYTGITDSFKAYHTAGVLTEFKETTSQVSDVPFTSSSTLARVGRPFEFPDGFNSTFGPERVTTAEVLFNPALYELPGVALPENAVSQGLGSMIMSAVNKCDSSAANAHESSARLVLNNVILAGGTSLIQGLAARVELDLKNMFPGFTPRLNYSAQNAADTKNLNWTGASILASLGTFDQNFWISKQEYEEFGRDLVEKRFK